MPARHLLRRLLREQPKIPDREQVTGDELCPPHDFIPCWLGAEEEGQGGIVCAYCGDVRLLKLPEQ